VFAGTGRKEKVDRRRDKRSPVKGKGKAEGRYRDVPVVDLEQGEVNGDDSEEVKRWEMEEQQVRAISLDVARLTIVDPCETTRRYFRSDIWDIKHASITSRLDRK